MLFELIYTLLLEVASPQLAVELLDRAGILCNACELPWDEPNEPTGLRLGTQVLTRRGLTEVEMEAVAESISQVLVHQCDPDLVHHDLVQQLACSFDGVAFSFDARSSDANAPLPRRSLVAFPRPDEQRRRSANEPLVG